MITKKLKIRGHIIDSLILSKLLDKISDCGIECYAENVIVGRRRQDVSEAVFVIDTNDEAKMAQAIEIAKKQGAQEI